MFGKIDNRVLQIELVSSGKIKQCKLSLNLLNAQCYEVHKKTQMTLMSFLVEE